MKALGILLVAGASRRFGSEETAIEVTNGAIAWDDLVAKYLPNFKLSNKYVSEHGTVGDFFAHRAGLLSTAGDNLEDLGFKRDEIIARLQHVPLDSFRNSYHYGNYNTTISAEAVARWDHALSVISIHFGGKAVTRCRSFSSQARLRLASG